MANLVCRATGNLTATGTWKTVETGTRAIQATHSASTNTTTSNVYNANAQDFTIANLSVIEGIMLFCKRVNTTGTVRVTLSQDSGTSATRTVTVNASDLPASQSWVFFKFGSTLTGDGGTDYAIAIQGSSAGNATFYRDGTAANWSHFIVTDQNPGSVAAGDVFYVVGELTGTGTGNDFTVTMDSTATTDYGTGTDGAESNGIDVGKRGILQYGTSASTNYYLKLSGTLIVWGDGVFNMGTTGTPIPRTSTAVLEFDPVADGGMGLRIAAGGTFVAQGLSRTSGKDVFYCLLNTDEAAAQTTLGVDTDTGWLNGDEIAIAGTGTTYNEYELRTLNADAGASSLSISSGLTNAHSGTAPTQAEVILLTRNVKIRSASSTLMSYMWVHASATSVNVDWVEFRYFGENTTNKRGVECDGVVNINYCSFRDFEDHGLYCNTTAATSNVSNNVFYNVGSATSSNFAMRLDATQLGAYTANNCIIIGVAATTGSGIRLSNPLSNIDNCRISGLNSGTGVTNVNTGTASGDVFTRVFTGVIIHSSGTATGHSLSSPGLMKFIDCYVWNCGIGVSTSSLSSPILYVITFETCRFWGNSTADFSFPSWHHYLQILLENCELGSSTEVANQSQMMDNGIVSSFVKSTRNDQTNGSHKTWVKYGTIQSDSTIYRTASPSERLTPNNASGKLQSGSKHVAVASGETVDISVYVRESVVGDGTDYNGNRIRLLLKKNIAMGITSDTVIDTATASSEGSFEQLTGTTSAAARDGVFEFVVDCDGTTGWVNVDDWSAT